MQQKYIQQLRQLIEDELSGAKATVFLFGSVARGIMRSSSDIDIAIDPLDNLAARKLSSLRERLEESTLPYRVDLVDLRHASLALREAVAREGMLWSG